MCFLECVYTETPLIGISYKTVLRKTKKCQTSGKKKRNKIKHLDNQTSKCLFRFICNLQVQWGPLYYFFLMTISSSSLEVHNTKSHYSTIFTPVNRVCLCICAIITYSCHWDWLFSLCSLWTEKASCGGRRTITYQVFDWLYSSLV